MNRGQQNTAAATAIIIYIIYLRPYMAVNLAVASALLLSMKPT